MIGAVGGWFYDRWAAGRANPEFAHRMGVLTATGMIVGESLFGVLFAAIVGATQNDNPLAVVGEGFAPVALVAGLAVFVALIAALYTMTRKAARG